mgnify:CR=1 FL=1
MHRKSTPLLPGFPHRLGRPRVPRIKRIREELSERARREFGELRSLFSPWVDSSFLAPTKSKANSRNRIFSLEVVFWGFLLQVLSNMGCRGAVAMIQSWMVNKGRTVPSSKPSAYSKARKRLPMSVLNNILSEMSSRISGCVSTSGLWHGRHVKVVDGTGLSAADTAPNQAQWPQSSNMTAGCGFPELKLTGLFCLHSGALLGWKEGNKHDCETRLWRKMWDLLCPGDVIVGDRAFGSYACIAALLQRGVDGLYRLHAARKVDWRKGRRLGPRDRVQLWQRPRTPGRGWTNSQWADLPAEIRVRLVQRTVDVPGFRSKKITVVTTLLDAVEYTADELVGLYRRRWAVELFLRDIKITLGMDVLTCKTPAMVRKELLMHLICYNLLRAMMQAAACQEGLCPADISFSATAETLSEWLWLFMDTALSQTERKRRLSEFYKALAMAPVLKRPDRVEPRVRKRRPKDYPLMTMPRDARKPEKTA